ncbi:MAG: ATP-binding protein, partial [Hyphomicrobiales bacterium]|nr:ATP-binding protein [Hyphomicrobiales bacterium]
MNSLVQSNKVTEGDIEKAFGAVVSGYISLVGPPGSGKSTLLQAGLLPIPSAIFVRYLAFVPDEGHGLGRAEAFDFLQDLISQLKRQGLGTKIVPATALPELRLQLVELLRQAAARFEVEGVRTVIVIDGLDHIP